MKKHLVVLSGAGISAESGLKTFRDEGGLWEQHRVEEVATPEAWLANPELVNRFYNLRRAQLAEVWPNAAHLSLKALESNFAVSIITQNVDDLHERAGSSHVLHLHGELTKVRSTGDPSHITDIGYRELSLEEQCPKGHPLRPHIVWFGEAVPMLERAITIARAADILLVVGTSLNVYPAAGLIHEVPVDTPIYLIDPAPDLLLYMGGRLMVINEKATTGLTMVAQMLS